MTKENEYFKEFSYEQVLRIELNDTVNASIDK